MTVYVVTEGSYSDYHIEAVFSTEALAEAYAGQSGGDVVEWEVDELAGWINREYWTRRLELSTGEVQCQSPTHKMHEMADPNKRTGNLEINLRHNFVSATSFVSEEHAHKLAVEGRQEWLRLGSPKSGEVTFESET